MEISIPQTPCSACERGLDGGQGSLCFSCFHEFESSLGWEFELFLGLQISRWVVRKVVYSLFCIFIIIIIIITTIISIIISIFPLLPY